MAFDSTVLINSQNNEMMLELHKGTWKRTAESPVDRVSRQQRHRDQRCAAAPVSLPSPVAYQPSLAAASTARHTAPILRNAFQK